MTITAQNVRSGSSAELKKWADQLGAAAIRSDVPQQMKQALQWAVHCLSVAADRTHRAYDMFAQQKDQNAQHIAEWIAFAQKATAPKPLTPSAPPSTPPSAPASRTPPSRPSPADWVRMAREQTGYGEGSNQRAKAWLEALEGQMEERIRRTRVTEERALLMLDLKNVAAAINSIRR
jgi:hypothetical protein